MKIETPIVVSEQVLKAILRRYPGAVAKEQIVIENGAVTKWDLEDPLPDANDRDVKIDGDDINTLRADLAALTLRFEKFAASKDGK